MTVMLVVRVWRLGWLGSAGVYGPSSTMAGWEGKCDVIACHTYHRMRVWDGDLMQLVSSQTDSWSLSCQAKGAGCISPLPCRIPWETYEPTYLCLHNEPKDELHISKTVLKSLKEATQNGRNPCSTHRETCEIVWNLRVLSHQNRWPVFC
jgi:hypothetical protein